MGCQPTKRKLFNRTASTKRGSLVGPGEQSVSTRPLGRRGGIQRNLLRAFSCCPVFTSRSRDDVEQPVFEQEVVIPGIMPTPVSALRNASDKSSSDRSRSLTFKVDQDSGEVVGDLPVKVTFFGRPRLGSMLSVTSSQTSVTSKISMERIANVCGHDLMIGETFEGVDSKVRNVLEALSEHEKQAMVELWKKSVNARPARAVSFGIIFLRAFLVSKTSQSLFPILIQRNSPMMTQKSCKQSHLRQTLDTVSLVVSNIDNLKSILRPVRKIGARHVGYGLESLEAIECYMAGILYVITKLLGLQTPYSVNAWYSVLAVIRTEFVLGMNRIAQSFCSIDNEASSSTSVRDFKTQREMLGGRSSIDNHPSSPVSDRDLRVMREIEDRLSTTGKVQ